MLGKRSKQRGFFEADHLHIDFVGRDTFYAFLASQRDQLFKDELFAAIYCADNGRMSVPPSVLATALLLQTYDGVSDEEAKARADYDLRWKVALGMGIEERPFAKSTLQVFRAQLVLHEKMRALFQESLRFARESGYQKKRKIKAVLDTSNILGRGAVKDTYNLLADGIVKLSGVLADLAGIEPKEWGSKHDLSRYFGSSIKGEATINWDDAKARQKFLNGIVADADRLLETAREAIGKYGEGSDERKRVMEAAELLGQLLLQDVERKPEGAELRQGVSRDRIVSVEDSEMRHGRKSKAKRFDGYKAAVAVDGESQLITAATVLAGNAPDKEQAMELVKETEENAEVEVEEAIGDCAFGDGKMRQEFAEAGRKLVAKVRGRPNRKHFPKEDFRVDLETKTCTCPAGQECGVLVRRGKQEDSEGKEVQLFAFHFDKEVCVACSLRGECVAGRSGNGRTVSLHPQEALIQEAREFQKSEEFIPYRKMRQVAEHRIGRLMQLGVRQARYFGRAKTLFQLLMAATVANLTLVASKMGLMRGRGSRKDCFCSLVITIMASVFVAYGWSLTRPSSWTLQPSSELAFRLDF